MMIHVTIRFALFYSLIFICCGPLQKENKTSSNVVKSSTSKIENTSQRELKYNFQTPSEVFVLDRSLSEISGLAYNSKDNTFISNNDESGRIFTLNPKSFNIVSNEKFAKKGDYESIEIIGNDIIACTNSGKLYFYDKSTKETKTYSTELSAKNDVEGLCYHKSSNSLLLACKGQPLTKSDNKKNEKCIYKFDLEQDKLVSEPFLTISDQELKSFVDSAFSNESKSKLKKLKNKAKGFSPSGIAIHPVTGDYFVISARGSLLVIIDKNETLKEIVYLNNKTNPQPEGICFDSENNLYISTEGQGYSGKIFKYNYNG